MGSGTPGLHAVVVDDEQSVLGYVAAILRDRNLKLFSSPLEALNFLDTLTEPPAILITDIMMPRLNGRDLGIAYQQRFPGLPVLLISGYTPTAVSMGGEVPPAWKFLGKPFTPVDLKQAVEGLTNQRTRRSRAKS